MKETLTLNIEKVNVLLTYSTDIISVYFKGPSRFPNVEPDEIPCFSMEVAKNSGVQYCKDNFDINPIVINTR